jgi:hypothetical protein
MLKKLHITPSGVIAIIALIFALTGGAFAATGGGGSGGGSSPAKATASVSRAQGGSGSSGQAIAVTAKSSKGKTGPRGPKGATGPAGPAGKNGANGTNGAPGAKGETGPAGASGVGVTSTPVAEGEEGCARGGVQLTTASGSTDICNGQKGTKGTTGTPGTPGAPGAIHPGNPVGSAEPLPPEATETGAWKMEGTYGEEEYVRAIASFPIPLAESGTHGEFLSKAETAENPRAATHECQGTAAHPTAPPGYICVYTTEEKGSVERRSLPPLVGEPGKFSPAGALFQVETAEESGTQFILQLGTWAVTACNSTLPAGEPPACEK